MIERLGDHLQALLEQRAVHVTEMQGHADAIDAIDAELNEARAALGVTSAVSDDTLPSAIAGFLERNGPSTLKALQEHSGRSFYRVNRAIGELGASVEMVGNTTRRFVRLRGDDRTPPGYTLPERKPRALAPRTQDMRCVRPGCGVVFRPSGGTSGLYCSRACYDAVRSSRVPQPVPLQKSDAAAAIDEPLEPHLQEAIDKLDRSHAAHGVAADDILPRTSSSQGNEAPREPIRAPFPERRCGRCMHKFRPTKEREYVCPACIDKPTVRSAQDAVEYEVVRSGRDAVQTADGFGSSLNGESRLHR